MKNLHKTKIESLEYDRLTTRFGGTITKLLFVECDLNSWWVGCMVKHHDNPEAVPVLREYHPCRFVHDGTKEGYAQMEAVSKAVMDHLDKYGEWNRKTGDWRGK